MEKFGIRGFVDRLEELTGSLSASLDYRSQPVWGALTGSDSVLAAAIATKIDKEACRAAYSLVRDDGSAVILVTFRYDGSTIDTGKQGADYQHFIQQCTDDVRLFAFVHFTTGDAMSKRSKFALITWIGEDVSGLQRAKMGTNKTLVKEVVQNFAKEFVISDRKELEENFIRSELKKAGGANYDAQTE
ncbi:coactosin [Sigmodon hispidus]